MTTVERIAAWACDVVLADIPEPVVDLARAQRRSVLAAMAASAGDAATGRVRAGIDAWAADGPCRLPGGTRPLRVDDAVYAATAMSIALDFDDYLCFAHSGHSAVLVPMLMAAETDGTGALQLAAQIVANEVEGRLGGACLLGPLNGQLWSFVHAAGAALAAGRMLGLGSGPMSHALAIALYQAPRPTVPGFMAPDSKVLTASEPTAMGVRAARLAAAGVTGPLDVLDHPQGFLRAFAYAPLAGLLGGLGVGWTTNTLSVKRHPGCAYVDTTIDALGELGRLDPADIAGVTVDSNVLTCEMNALSHRYATDGVPTPVTMNFSVPWNVASMLLAGQLTPTETDASWLQSHRGALADLAKRVTVRHDWSLTMQTARAMAPLLPVRSITSGVGRAELLGALRRLRRDHEGLRVSGSDALALAGALRSAGPAARAALNGRVLWSPDALEEFVMTFPARVRVALRSGQELEATVAVPAGGAGNRVATPELVSREKLAVCGPAVWGTDATEAIAKAVDTDSPGLWTLLGLAR